MRKVMFVGGAPSRLLGTAEFTRFGQVEELDLALVEDAARGKCVILPADAPAAAAFTAEELRKYGSFGALEQAPADFRARVKAARIAAAEFRAQACAAHDAAVAASQRLAGDAPAPQGTEEVTLG